MSNEEKNKKTNKGKVAFMFAFAVTVLGSRAGALTASAASAPGGNDANDNDGNENSNGQYKEVGADNGFIKQDSNVYLASEEAASVADFRGSLDGLRGFAVYAKSLNASHTEGNICVDNVNVADVYNTNVASKLGEQAPKNYTLYLAEPPTDSNWISIGMQSGTNYELVLGFDYEESTYDNGNKVSFFANGQEYFIQVNGDLNNFSIRRANDNDDFTDINAKLKSMAAAGQALIDQSVAAGFEADDSLNGLFYISDDFTNNSKHLYNDGQTLVVNIDANCLNTNESNIYLQNIVTQNNGVNVIVNVITNENTKNVNLGMTNGAEWNLQAANVVFNFGDYDGDICSSSMMGGIIVAPMANYKLGGNLNGSVYAKSVDQTCFEIHQITEDDRVVPPATPDQLQTPSKDGEQDSDVIQDKSDDNNDTDKPENEEITGGGNDDNEQKEDTETGTGENSDDDSDDTKKGLVDDNDDSSSTPPVNDDTSTSDSDDNSSEITDESGTDTPVVPGDDIVNDTTDEQPKSDTTDEQPKSDTTDEQPKSDTPENPSEEIPVEPQDNTPDEPQDDTPEDEVIEPVIPDVEDEFDDGDEFTDNDIVDENEEDIPEVDEPEVEPSEDIPSDNTVVTDDTDVPEDEPTEPVETAQPSEPSKPAADKPIDFDDIELDDFDDNTPTENTPTTNNQVNNFVMIDDDEVPLGDNPYTGVEDTSAGLGLGAAVALGASVAAASLKKKNNKKDS